ncbi:hypothetical protein I3843_16G037200 [Carya illinoinensis]|uniref:Cytochrome b5 heme-binding domain-containing protein n=1 Tax=Carya illinoinensis TaxID=32201 RepID=A0A8T1N699_CARIL|nr:cytochrome b5-like [Carya illinoinensis]KAG2663542.1 hypothetical protein I3760_16G035900 [Carya illinoinensis]KAG6624544.1 hypothetical protein CIPAW_16G034500 [Carya illinoinensis]KAG6671995.1 hypothetical protein I3842_16G034000 [Carya illinoinensis]KAG7941357.1 hypothetical protein I3843_16G037200 [Carya illinoinensis]
MAGRIFTLSQVERHRSKKDCWLVINGRVLNVTKFLKEHPGGEEVLMESAGKDASKEFEDVGHSKGAQSLLRKYQVGVLQGHIFEDEDSEEVAYENKAEMTAVVIKHDRLSKFLRLLLEYFVPFLIGASYFCYRYFTRAP